MKVQRLKMPTVCMNCPMCHKWIFKTNGISELLCMELVNPHDNNTLTWRDKDCVIVYKENEVYKTEFEIEANKTFGFPLEKEMELPESCPYQLEHLLVQNMDNENNQ